MFPFNLVRWLKSWNRARHTGTYQKKPRFRLALEELETRLAPATHTWTGGGGNTLWSNAGNWTAAGGAPSAASPLDDVVFPASVPLGLRTAQNDISGLVLNSIQINASTYTLSAAVPIDFVTLGSPGAAGSGTLFVSAGAADTISMPLQLAGPNANQQFFTINAGASLTIAGAISGTTGSQLTKEGTGTLFLNGNNSGFLGPVTIPNGQGIISINNANALGSPQASEVQAIALTGPGAGTTKFTLTFNGITTGNITYTGTPADATAIQTALNGLSTIGGVGGSVVVTSIGNVYTVTFGGALANLNQTQLAGAITAGAGSIATAVLVTGGPTTNVVTVGNNSQLQINGGAGIGPIPNALFLSGTGIANDGALLSLDNPFGANTWSGNIQLVTDADIGVEATPVAFSNVTLTITGQISDAGAGHSLTKVGNGQLVLTNANTYRGSTSINWGILTIENPLALGSVPTAGTYINDDPITGDMGTLRLAYIGGAALPANPQDFILQNPAQPYNAATNPYVGFTVANVPLFAFGGGFFLNTIENFEGNNAWTGNIILGTTIAGGVPTAPAINFAVDAFGGVNTSFTVSGIISDDATRVNGAWSKWGPGNLILEPTNAATGLGAPNTWTDKLTLWAGVVTLEDSQGFGLATSNVQEFMFSGGSIHLKANVGHVDSITHSTTELQVDTPISIAGPGPTNEGALDSVAGINTYVANPNFNGPVISLSIFAATTGIGVVAEPFESNNNAYLTDDYSLTITGGIGEQSNNPAPTLAKVGTGDLILPNANTAFTGPTMINGGWVTMRDPDALGSRLVATSDSGQSLVTVNSLASLQLLPLVAGTSFDFFHNLVLSGEGNLNTYSLIDNAGALINLGGDNTVSGNVSLVGTAAIGVVQLFPNDPSQLTITGELSSKAASAAGISVSINPSGGSQENDQIIDTGSTSGSITIMYQMYFVPDDLRVYYPPFGQPGSTKIFDTGLISGSGTAVVNYGPGTSTTVEIIMDQGGGSSGTAWTYTAVIHPNVLTSSSGLIKLGDGRLVLDGPGDYSGGTDIRQGVIQVANNTALGAPQGTSTVVEAGAALELVPTDPLTSGGISAGPQITNNPLVLNGSGDPTFGDAPLSIAPDIDAEWDGPITLNTNVYVQFQNALGDQNVGTMTANDTGLAGTNPTLFVDPTTNGGADPITGQLYNENQALTFGGAITGGSFTLTFTNPTTNVSATTTPITWNSNPNTLDASIQKALNALPNVPANSVAVTTSAPDLYVAPDSRLSVAGAISDLDIPTDLVMNGGGELLLAGDDTYRGNTLVNQGTLTIANGAALGSGATSEVQSVTLIGAIPNATKFTLTFNGATTAVIPYTGAPADAATVQAALDELATIGGVGGWVTVTKVGAVFTITFDGNLAGFNQNQISAALTAGPGILAAATLAEGDGGTFVAKNAAIQMEGGVTVSGVPLVIQGTGAGPQSEVQALTLSGAETGTYTLGFNGQTTGPLAYNATADQVQAALQGLSSVGAVGGIINVSETGASGGVDETQELDFAGATAGVTKFTLTVTLGGSSYTTAPLPLNGNATDQAKIQNALIGLLTANDIPGSFSVEQYSIGTNFAATYVPSYTILFQDALADAPQPLMSAAVTAGGGSASITEITPGSGPTESFNFAFQGSFVGALEPALIVTPTGGLIAAPSTTVTGGTANATPYQWQSVGPAPVSKAIVFMAGGTKQNAAGPITGVTVDNSDPSGNTILVSTAGGGAWKTVDGGTIWTPLFDNVGATMWGGAIAYAPGNPNVVYFGTGAGNNSVIASDYSGTGIYKSTDGGHTWALVVDGTGNNPLVGEAVNKIVVDPADPNQFWAATSDQQINNVAGKAGVWRFDGGNWLNMTKASGLPSTDSSYTDLALTNQLGAALTLYFALGTETAGGASGAQNGVYTYLVPRAAAPALSPSTFPIGVGGIITIAAIAGGNQLTDTIYASVEDPVSFGLLNVFVSVNGGGAWAPTTLQPGEYLAQVGDYANTIVAQNANIVYVGGVDQASGNSFVYRTANGGTTWTDISSVGGIGPNTYLHSMSLDSSNNLIVGTDGGVWRYNIASGTWTDLNGNLGDVELTGVASSPAAASNVLGGSPTTGAFFNNGTTLTWTQTLGGATGVIGILGSNGGYFGEVAFDPDNPLIAYQAVNTNAFSGGQLMMSSNGGATTAGWVATNFFPATAGLFPFAVDTVDPARLVAGADAGAGANGSVQESLNQGNSWTNLGAPLLNATSVAISAYQGTFVADPGFANVTDLGAANYDGNTVYASDGIKVVVTKNGGQTWVTRTPILSGGTHISDLEVDPRNRDTVFVITQGYAPSAGVGRVFESTDAGQTWTDISAGLPDVPAWQLAIDPRSNNLYVGTDDGVWALNGGVGTWSRFAVGLPDVSVQVLDLNQATNTLTVGTYGRGAFQIALDDGAMNAGALRAVSGSDVWSGPIYLAGPTTISANGTQSLLNGVSAAQLTIVGALADQTPGADYAVTKIGEGDVILAGSNTFGGTVEVQQGNLVVHNPDALGSVFTSEVQTVTIGGAAVGTFTLTFNGQTTPSLLATLTPLQLATALDSLASIGGVLGFVDVTEPSPGVFTVAFAGSLTGQVLPVMSASPAGGATVVTAIATPGLTVGTGGTTVDSGAALELETSVDGEPITLNGDGIQPAYNGYNSGALVSLSNTNTYTGTLTLATSSTIGVDSGSFLTISGSITDGANNFSLDKEGPGTLVLSGADSYHGGTNIDQGVLSIQSNLGLGFPGSTVTVFDGAQLQIQGGITVTGDTLKLSGSGIFGTGALLNVGGNNSWAGNVILGSFPYLLVPSLAPATVPATTVVLGITAGDLTIDGAVSETGGSFNLTEVGTGKLVLQQADAYTGLTTISTGATLNVEDSKALSGYQTDIVAGATLEVQANTVAGHVDSVTGTPNVSINEPLFVNGAGVNGAGAIHNVGSAVQTITLSNPVAGGFNPTQFTLTFNGSTTTPITYTGVAATDAANIMNALNLLASILGVGGSVSVTSLGGNIFTVLFGGNLSPIAVPTIGASIVPTTPGSIAVVPTTTGGLSDNAITGAITLQTSSTINSDANTHLTISGIVQDPVPAPVPPANVTKIGAGSVILTSANTYTGVTNINAGIVNIQNSQALGLNTTEVQTVTVQLSGGTFSLNFNGQVTTPAFAAGASAALVQAELNALSTISAGGGSVQVTAAGAGTGTVYTITFNGGPLAFANQPQISVTTTGGVTATTATVLNGGQGGTVVAAGATLQVQSSGVPVVENTETLTLNGNGISNAGLNLGALDNVGGNNSWNVPITLAGNASIGAENSTNTLTLTQPISDNLEVQTITFPGFTNGSTFTLSFDNTVTLPITFSAVAATTATNIQNALNALASITLLGGSVTVTPVAGTFSVKFGGGMDGATTWPQLVGVRLTGAGAVTVTPAAPFSSGFSLTKVGLGTVLENAGASNTYSGPTTVQLGSLNLDDANNIIAVPSNVVTVGSAGSNQLLFLNGFTAGNTYQLVFNGTPTATITWTGKPVADAAAIQEALSAIVGAGNTVVVSPDYQNDFLVLFGGGLAATVVPPLTANILTGTGTLTNLGPKTVALLQQFTNNQIANTAALTLFNDAKYNLGNANLQTIGSLNMTGGKTTLTAGSVLTLAGNVTATSNALGDASIRGAGTLSEGGVARTFTVNAGTQPSDLVIDSVITGTAGEGLNKAGTGRLELTAVETYTGPTTISAGDVQVDAGAAIQNVVLSGGSVSGQGSVATIAGPAGAAVGTINPGINGTTPIVTGVLDTGSITAGQPTVINVDLNHTSPTAPVAGADYDQVNVAGNVNLGGLGAVPGALLTGTSTLNVQQGDAFTIIQATGTLTGFLSRLVGAVQTPIPNGGTVFLSGQKFVVQYTANSVVLTRQLSTATVTITAAPGITSVYGQDVVFTATVVPEVGAALPAAGGQVTFTLDANTVNALTKTVAVVGGVATFDPQAYGNFTWSLGTHTIDATFTDTNVPTSFAQAHASTLVQTVNQGPTSVAVIAATPSVTPVYGQPVTITAAVTPTVTPTTNGSIFPTGTVTFTVDPGPSQLIFPGINLSASQASVTLPNTLGVGVHHVHVVYNGDTNYQGSAIASDFVVTVLKDSSVVTVTGSPGSPALLGQAVTFTAAVTPALAGSPGQPTGTVNFYDGAAVPANLLNVSPIGLIAGSATFTDANLAVAVHTITVVYLGDPNYQINTGTLSYTVGLVNTSTSLTSVPTSSTFGQPVTLTAAVAPNVLGFGTPSGTVTFFDTTTSTTLGTSTLNAAGVATLTTAALSTNNHVITATYSGDTNFSPSTGTIGNFQVNPATTSTALSAIPGGADVFGEAVTLTAAVAVTSPGAPGTPGGTVTFTDATTNTPLGTTALNAGGVAVLSTSVLTVNAHTITAVFNGAVNFAPSSGIISNYVVAGDSSSVTVTAAPANSVFGQAVAFTASVVGAAPGSGLPVNGGVVVFYDGPVGSTIIGTGTLNNGLATLNYSGLAVTTHNISVAFAGDMNLAGSNGVLANFLVSPANTTVAVSAAPPGGVNFGNTATFTASVSASLPGAGTPADGDLVTFKDGAATLGTAILSGGVATFATSSLSAGSHTISATFDGDASFGIGTGFLAAPYNVVFASTTTAVTVAPTAGDVFGQSVSLTAVVSNTSGGTPGIPGGTVSFWDGPVGIGILLGTRTLVGGQTTLVTTALSVNTALGHTINASYSGNVSFAGSVGTLTNYLVAQDSTTTTVATLQTSPVLGQPVQFTASVLGNVPGSGTPSNGDLITFRDNGVFIGNGTLAGGVASFTDNNLTLGTHTITAIFAGDASYIGSTGTLANFTVAPAATTTTVSAVPASPTVFGQLVTISATVGAASPGTGIPANGDSVSFYDGAAVVANLIGTSTLISGVASVNTSSLIVGTHTLTAVFGGDANYTASTGMLANYAITQAGTQTVLAPMANVVYGQPAIFTATVSASSGVGIPNSGTITFYDSGASLGTATLSGSNSAAFTTTNPLALGNHSITAVYNGGGNFLASPASNTQIQNVGQAGSSMAITESAPTVGLGMPVTFTATVTPLAPSTAAITSGTVTFKDGAVTIGTVTLSGTNIATLNTSALTLGAHQISAAYAATADYTGSTSSLLLETILNVVTITPTSTPPAPLFGQTTSLTVGVTGTGAAPTGTVTITDTFGGSTTTLASNVSFASAIDVGDGSVLHPDLAAGVHSLLIQYSGDSNYAPGSKTINLTVGLAVTATTLTSSAPTPAPFGEPLIFTATVNVTNPVGGVAPTSGTVTFKDGGLLLGTVTLSGTNVATYSSATFAVATHSITATYSGSANDAGSTGTIASYVVKAAATSTVVSGVPSPSSFGQAVTFTATVTATSPSAATVASGTVTFKDGTTTLGTGAVTNGVATFTTSTLTATTHSITAVYAATTNFAASTSAIFAHVVAQAGTNTSLTSSLPLGSSFGQSVTFKATVTNSVGGTNPTSGSVVFKDGATTLATIALSGGNTASFNIATLDAATSPHSITASYVANTTYGASTSNTVTQTVKQVGTVAVLGSSPVNWALGQAVVFTATLTSPTGAVPTGTAAGVIFTITGPNGTVTPTATSFANGKATVSYTFPSTAGSAGSYSVSVSYAGNADFAASSAGPVTQPNVRKASTITLLTSNSSPGYGAAITFTATVSGTGGPPTGTVSFFDGTTFLGTGTLVNGKAKLTTSTLSIGSHKITATYGGDANFNPAVTATALSQNVSSKAIGRLV